MATITASSFRAAVTARLGELVGRLNITDSQLDEAGHAAFQSVYPHLYRLTEETGLLPAEGRVSVSDVHAVVRVTTLVDGCWPVEVPVEVATSSSLKLPRGLTTPVDVTLMEPYLYPEGSAGVSVPAQWVDTLYLAGQVTVLELVTSSRQAFRGYQPNTDMQVDSNEILSLLGSLRDRLQQHLAERALNLPGVAL